MLLARGEVEVKGGDVLCFMYKGESRLAKSTAIYNRDNLLCRINGGGWRWFNVLKMGDVDKVKGFDRLWLYLRGCRFM